MKLTEDEMTAMMRQVYLRIVAGGPTVIAEYYDWMNALPADERDQISAFAAANDNENAPWRK